MLFEYPNTNLHELNLDWILNEVKNNTEKINSFIRANVLKYANPITWDKSNLYEVATIVENNGDTYLSIKEVPAGIMLSNEEYWVKIGLFNAQIEKAVQGISFIKVNSLDVEDNEELISVINKCVQRGFENIDLCGMTFIVSEAATIADNISLYNGNVIIIGEHDGLILGNNCTLTNVHFTDNNSTYINSYYAVTATEKRNISINLCTFDNIHLQSCIRLFACSNCNIEYNTINTYSIGGIMLSRHCDSIRVNYNNVFDGSNNTAGYRYPIALGSYTSTADGVNKNIECKFNVISDITAVWEGIDAHGLINAYIANNVIHDTLSGIVITSTSTVELPSENVIIENNIITLSNASASTALGCGICVGGYHMKNIKVINNDITIANNRPLATNKAGIYFRQQDAVNDYSDNIVVENNIINCPASGMYIGGSHHSITILNNTLTGNANADYPAINLSPIYAYDSITIKGNIIHDTPRALRGPYRNAYNSNKIISVNDNVYKNITNQIFTDGARFDNPRTASTIGTIDTAEIGTFVHASTYVNNIIGWYCTVSSNIETSTKPTFTALKLA